MTWKNRVGVLASLFDEARKMAIPSKNERSTSTPKSEPGSMAWYRQLPKPEPQAEPRPHFSKEIRAQKLPAFYAQVKRRPSWD